MKILPAFMVILLSAALGGCGGLDGQGEPATCKVVQSTAAERPPCPKCASIQVLEIRYGYPNGEMFRSAERGEIVLGGCVVSNHSPKWQCTVCKHSFNP